MTSWRKAHRAIGMLVLVLAGNAAAEESVVPRDLQVAEGEARRQLAEWLSYRSETRAEAIRLYESLLAEDPESEELVLALLKLHGEGGNNSAIEALGSRYPEIVESSAMWWLLLADQSLSRGQLAEARRLIAEAELRLAPDEPAATDLERRRLAWGDFSGVARRLDDRIRKGAERYEVWETLAEALNAAGRRTEAAAVLRRLHASSPVRDSARLLLVRILHADKRYAAALAESTLLLEERPDWAEARRLHLRLLIEDPESMETAWPASGWIEGAQLAPVEKLWREQRQDEARELLESISPSDEIPERVLHFWKLLLSEVQSLQEFTDRLLSDLISAPWQLSEWAWRMAEYGRYRQGVRLMEAAVQAAEGAERFQMELAELYAIAGHFDESLDLYRALINNFPDSSKLRMGLARALSWAQEYDESLETYADLHTRYPEDPEVLREMARVAGWSKQFAEAQRIFVQLFRPSIDVLLGLTDDDEADTTELGNWRPYEEYERSQEKGVTVPPLRIAAAERTIYATAVMDAETLYQLQKGAYLEYRAKRRVMDLRYQRAEMLLTELVLLEPGNREARFDLAQARCSLGLKRSRDATYEALLRVAPLHKMGNRALEISGARHRPVLAVRGSWMEEEGDERLADMRIQLAEIGALFYPGKQTELAIFFGRQRERTRDASYASETTRLFALEGAVVFSAELSGSAGIRQKRYERAALGRRTTGFLGLQGNIDDWLRPRIRWSRQEMLANGQSREDRILMNQWEMGATLVPDRQWDVDLHLHWNRFSDDNEQVAFGLRPSWMWADHPRELRFFANLEYRDTEKESVFPFSNGVPERVVHPYWTPQDYLGGNIGLHWRHDLMADPFCGNLEHYYEVRVDLGGGNDENRGVGLEASWVRDLGVRWRFELSGRLHRSRQWDASALSFSLRRHF